jgi:PAS domain S-box-containing protein
MLGSERDVLLRVPGSEKSSAETESADMSATRLQRTLALGDLALWDFDVARGEVAPSPELNRLYGFPPEATPSIEDYYARYAPGEVERIGALSAAAQARGESRVEYEIRQIWPDGTTKWLQVRSEAAGATIGSSDHIVGIVYDVTERKAAEAAVAESERRFRLSQEAAGIASVELDVASGEVIGSENFWALWGLTPRRSVHISLLESLVLPEFRNIRSTAAATRRTGTARLNAEYQIRRADTGEIRWLSRHMELVRDATRRPEKMFGVMQDITLAKQTEQRQVLLTHELQHRIKNILATVGAIASQTLRDTDIDTAREMFDARIKALSEAHNVLTGTGWTTASMTEVLHRTLGAHRLGHRVDIDGGDLRLNPRMALSLALAVNELATNAIKYGALSVAHGRVDIDWCAIASRTGGETELQWRWRESGGPVVLPPSRKGFGTVLVERVLGSDFGGNVSMDFHPEGLAVVLRMPLANLPE